MATAADLITAAFNKVGVYSPSAAQNASALISLNNMLSFWGAEGLQYVPVSESLVLTAGDSTYTVGATGDINTVRPMKVENCFLRDSDGNDYPCGYLAAKDYNAMSLKTYSMRPTKVYFLPEYPLAKLIFNSEPDAAYTTYFEFLKPFTEFATSATAFALPPEYKEAIVYNLAISLAEDWNRTVPQTVQLRAVQTKTILDNLNSINKIPPIAKFDFNGNCPSNIETGE